MEKKQASIIKCSCPCKSSLWVLVMSPFNLMNVPIKGWLCCHCKGAICNKQADLCIVDSPWQREMRCYHPAAVFYIRAVAAGATAVQPMKYEWLYSHWSCHRELYFEENSQMETVSFIYWCCLLLLEGLTWKGKRHWYNEVSACCWLQCQIWHTEYITICLWVTCFIIIAPARAGNTDTSWWLYYPTFFLMYVIFIIFFTSLDVKTNFMYNINTWLIKYVSSRSICFLNFIFIAFYYQIFRIGGDRIIKSS